MNVITHIKKVGGLCLLLFSVSTISAQTVRLIDKVSLINTSILNIYGFNTIEHDSYGIDNDVFWWLSNERDSLLVKNLVSGEKNSIALAGEQWTSLAVNDGVCSVIEQIRMTKYRVTSYIFSKNEVQFVNQEFFKNLDEYYYDDGSKKAIAFYNVDASLNSMQFDVKGKVLDVPITTTLSSLLSPNRFVDFSTDYNLVVDPTSYKLSVYDNNLHLVSSKPPSTGELWDSKYFKDIEKQYDQNNKQQIFGRLQKGATKLNLIWNVSFIDKTKVAVIRSYPSVKSFKLSIDVVDISKQNAEIIASGLYTVWGKDDDVIGVDCLPFYVGGIGVSILFDNGYLYAIVSDIKEDIIGWKNKKYKSVKSSYLTEHNPVVKIYKYAIIY